MLAAATVWFPPFPPDAAPSMRVLNGLKGTYCRYLTVVHFATWHWCSQDVFFAHLNGFCRICIHFSAVTVRDLSVTAPFPVRLATFSGDTFVLVEELEGSGRMLTEKKWAEGTVRDEAMGRRFHSRAACGVCRIRASNIYWSEGHHC